jgi:heptosyltransferase III
MEKTAFILHNGALGDLLLSLPAFSVIKEEFPVIHLAGRADAVELLCAAGMVAEASDSGSARFSSLYRQAIDADLKSFFKRFQAAFIFTATRESLPAGNIGACIPHTRVIFTLPPEGINIHVADYRLTQLSADIGTHRSVLLPAHPAWRDRALRMLDEAGWDRVKHLVAIHPGSGGPRKCWPLDHFRELAHLLHSGENVFLVFFTGPAESGDLRDVMDAVVSGLPGDAAHFSGLGLPEVSTLLGLCSVYVGNDSGLTHTAAVAGTRVIALFGPTDPILWRPLGDKVTVLQGPLDCAPCSDGQSRLCRERTCLSAISPHDVFREASGILEGC